MRKILLVGTAGLIAAGAAFAQPVPPVAPAPPAPPAMMMMHHGKTQTRAQVQQHVAAMFARLDTNRDGVVTREEARVAHEKMMGDMHKRMEKGAGMDGMPKPDRAAMFDRMDTNKDGMISRQEYMAAKPQVYERRVMVMHGAEPGKPGEPGMEMHGMAMRMHGGMAGMGDKMFDMADANHDGRVTLQEMTAAALQHFDMADTNHDGQLTPEERRQAHQRMRGEHTPG